MLRLLGCWVLLMGLACSSDRSVRPPPVTLVEAPNPNPPPRPTPAPECVSGALVTPQRVCGLGVAGRGYRWNDPRIRGLAERRAAENLAGMLRSVVTSALVLAQDEGGYWSQEERYLEIDEALVDQVAAAAKTELWFDTLGEGPFRAAERTYACACMSAAAAGIRVDGGQVAEQAWTRQYAVDEVPSWIEDRAAFNRSLRCAVGFQPRMYHPEEMLGPLTDSVRSQLMRATRTWVLSRFDDRTVCGGRDPTTCRARVDSMVEAANEGVSRGVALSAVWYDPLGLGPDATQMSAYGWGCVFDAVVLEAARKRLQELRSEG